MFHWSMCALSRALGGAVVASAVLLPCAATAQTVQLKLADRLPQDHYVARYSTNHFIEQVESASKGTIKIERYPNDRLGKSKDMLTLTKAGITDIGELVPGYLGDPMLLSTVAELPGMVPNACAASLAYEAVAKPGALLDKLELSPAGVRLLYVVGLPAYQLFASRKFDTLESMKGMKVRSSGPAMDVGLRQLGMVPIRMAASELSESFSRGTVDGYAFPAASVGSYDLQGKTKFGTTDLSFGSSMTFYAITTKAWNRLTPEQQKILADAGERTTRHACALIDKEEQDALKRLESASMTAVRLSPDDRRKYESELSVVGREWAEAVDKRGRKGTETLDAFRAAIKTAR